MIRFSFDLKKYVSDPNNDAVTISIVTGPERGALELIGDGVWRYRPNADYSGFDSFTFRGSDGSLLGTIGTATLEVGAFNDPPQLGVISPVTINEGDQLVINPRAIDRDGDIGGTDLTWSLGSAPAGATINRQTGQVMWTAIEGPDTEYFTVIVTDAGGASVETRAKVTILDVPPQIQLAVRDHAVLGESVSLELDFIDPGSENVAIIQCRLG